MLFSTIPNQIVNVPVALSSKGNIQLAIKREDEIHPFVSGNKFRKLIYNVLDAQKQGKRRLLTFGGAFSNHIAALAYAGKATGMETIGVIRGDELVNKTTLNPTLEFAKSCGMHFKYVSREAYREKETPDFIAALHSEFEDFYLVPEGGTNTLAVKGCEEILTEADAEFDFICCAVGTGGTISGLINSSKPHQKILGFPALKGDFLKYNISKFVHKTNWDLITDYHFGGYAKVNVDLIQFINQFKAEHLIPLDPVYTGKVVYGVFDLIHQGFFPESSKILVIHTGGLQGIDGMNIYLKNKKLPIII